MEGRVPPNSLEAEQSILGSMLLSETCTLEAISKLKEVDFYSKSHRTIFGSMHDLVAVGKPVDLVTVIEKIEQNGKLSLEELSYLSNLSQRVPSVSNINHYINIVKEKSLLRKLIETCGDIAELSFKGELSASEIINFAGDSIYKITDDSGGRELEHIQTALFEAYEMIGNTLLKSESGIMGTRTGFPIMDGMLSGVQPSQLIIVAGRPGMGKTSFALNMIEHIALKEKKTVAMFSLEMSRDQLAMRLLCGQAMVDSQRLRVKTKNDNKLDSDFERIADAMQPLGESPIYIDDSPVVGVTEMLAKARRLKRKTGDIGAVVIDYLQLMNGSSRIRNENRQQEIANITRSLKIMARDLKVPIILLSQLSRATEKRENKRPMLSDLRESGAIEQDADVVLFLHREDYYGGDEQGQGKSQIIIAKQRSGPTGSISVEWIGEQTRYKEIDFVHEEQ